MNKARRQALQVISVKLEDIETDITMLRDEEQEYADNMPESLQNSEKHANAENAVSCMDDAINSIAETIDSIGQSID